MRWKILVYIGKVFELCACPDDGPVQVLHNLIHHFFSLLLVCLLLVCFFFKWHCKSFAGCAVSLDNMARGG